MNSRMDKYLNEQGKKLSNRIDKNQKLYDEVSDIDAEYIDINNSNVFELSNRDNQQKSRLDYQKVKEMQLNQIISNPIKKSSVVEEPLSRVEKIYDINEILKKAKEDKNINDQKKRLISTEYNILTKLDVDKINNSNDFNADKYRQIIDNLYAKERVSHDNNKELFQDLIDNSDNCTRKENTISSESINNINDNNLNMTISSDEEQAPIVEKTREVISNENEDLEDDFAEEKKRPFLVVIIVIIVLGLLGVGAYLLLKYFGTI